ncbi:MAG: sulfotransferase family protein [Cytophagaceae bacterium]
MKLIGAGFGRTGTNSTYEALNELGFPCYHMVEVIRNRANKKHLDFWNKVANEPEGQQHNWTEVFANYRATVDFPGSCVYKELMLAYPDAKVILTLHPKGAEGWYKSVINTIYFSESTWQFQVLRLLTPYGRKMGNMSRKLIWKRFMKDCMKSKAGAIAFYNQHIENVKAAVPENKLLIYSVDQGWEPLCKFMGVPVPSTPFPNSNDTVAFQKTIRGMKMGAYVILSLFALLLSLIGYGLYKISG